MFDESHAAVALPPDVHDHVRQISYRHHVGLEVGELMVVVVHCHCRVDEGEAFQ